MRKLLFLILVMSICAVIIAEIETQGQTTEMMKLKWEVGDSWTVRTWYGIGAIYGDNRESIFERRGKPVDVIFEVFNIRSVKDHQCYEIKVTYPKDELGFQEQYNLYIRCDVGNLIRIVDSSIRSDGSSKNIIYDYLVEPNGPVLATNVSTLIPFDFPVFLRDKIIFQDKSRSLELSQKISKATSDSELIVTIGAKVNDGEIESVQKWEHGYPWWKEAKRLENGKTVNEAILLIEH